MASPHKYYLTHMHQKTGYRATWDPGRKLRIGQIIKLDRRGVVDVYSSLHQEGIPMEVETDTTGSEMDYTSSDSVTVHAKLSGEIPVAGGLLTEAEAGFDIQFKSSRSILFKASGYRTHHLTNLAQIEETILERYKNGNWDKSWLVITQLVEAGAATIIISNTNSGQLAIKAKGNVAMADLDLTNVALDLSVAREKGSTIKYLASEGLTPLYRAMGVRHPLLGKPGFEERLETTRGAAKKAAGETFQEQEFDAEEIEGGEDADAAAADASR